MSELLTRLAGVVAGRAVEPPRPIWAVANIPGADEAIQVSRRDPSSSWAGYMRYVDTHGEVSERRFVCRSIEGYGCAETIAAYCCERQGNRRFRIDRIEELMCLVTGEIIDPVPHFEQLRLHGAVKVLDKTLSDLGRILVFMSRCDGEVHPLEVAAVHEGMGKYVLRYGGSDADLARALKNICKIAPDGDDLVTSLERVGRHPESKQISRLILDCIGKVTMADGEIHADELEWGAIAQRYLTKVAG